jgi:anti-sigma B factor antagonist
MDVAYEIRSGVLVVRPSGLINVHSSPVLRQTLLDHYTGRGNIVVNLADVDFMDSSGLATLVEGLQMAHRGGGKLILCAIRNQMILDLLEITHLLRAFPIVESELAAIG